MCTTCSLDSSDCANLSFSTARYTRNATFLTDSTLATKDPTATPYALFKGLANWWVCHLTKEDTSLSDQTPDLSSETEPKSTLRSSYTYVDQDDCAYEDTNYYTRPSRHPQSQNLCNATAQTLAGNNQYTGKDPSLLRNPAISMGFLLKILKTAIETSVVLEVDAELRPAWQDRVDHMSSFPVRNLRRIARCAFSCRCNIDNCLIGIWI
jgi:hypothetical protein